MEIHDLVKRITKLSTDDRLSKEEQDVLFSAAVNLATYKKTVDDLQDSMKRLYEELVMENNE